MNKDVMGVQEVSPGYEFVAENPAVPTGYKHSASGLIPEEWEALELEQALTLQRGYDLPYRLRKVGNVPIISSSGASGLHDVEKVGPPGVVTGRYGTIGEVFYVKQAYWPLNTTLYVKDFKGNDSRFIYYLLGTVDFVSHSGKSGVPGVNRNDVHKEQIALPPIHEQHAIATALSDVDALLEELDRLIAKKRDIKQAAMQQLLTGETRLPGFEGEWEARRIGDVLEVRHGRSQKEVETKDGEYPIYASGGEIGRANTYLYSKPSVLIGRKGTIDAPRYCDQPFWTVDTLFYTELLDRNSAKFMYYKFCMIPWRNYNEASGVPSLSARTIENIEIVLPTHEEQEAIAAVLSDMDTEIHALEQRRSKTVELKQGMMQELLTGRTRLV
jgi:type I restriction enzyme S subunit